MDPLRTNDSEPGAQGGDRGLSFKLCTYNCSGLNDAHKDYVDHLLKREDIDILWLQETWLFNSPIDRLSDQSDQSIADTWRME